MTNKKSDYLKYWKVIRKYVKVKYNLNATELDMLLFLYSESYFTHSKMKQFNKLIGWTDRSFVKLRQDGFVDEVKKLSRGRLVFHLSLKAIRLVSSIYSMLDGKKLMNVKPEHNPILKSKNYSKKQYEEIILEMNEFIRQQQHLVLE